MNTSEKTDKIVLSLFGVIKSIYSGDKLTRDKKNKQFSNKYVPLTDLYDYVVPLCIENGIMPTQTQRPSRDLGEAYVVTRFTHVESNQWMESETTSPPMIRIQYDKKENRIVDVSPQSYCGAVTYSCRYGLQTFLCIPTYDDDGETASGRGSDRKQVQSTEKKTYANAGKCITAGQVRMLAAKGNASGWSVDDMIAKVGGKLEDIPESELNAHVKTFSAQKEVNADDIQF